MDTHKFFHDPVSDDIVPGYSAVISHPMCFLSMKQKLKNEEYANLDQICTGFFCVIDTFRGRLQTSLHELYDLQPTRINISFRGRKDVDRCTGLLLALSNIKGMKASNRAREKVSPEYYDTGTFYDPYNDDSLYAHLAISLTRK